MPTPRPCEICGKVYRNAAQHERNVHDHFHRGPRAAESERRLRQQRQAGIARAAKAAKAAERSQALEVTQPPEPTNGHAGPGTFKLMPFVVIEDDDGGIWIAERIR
jgi:hypothetical protein